MKNITQDSQNNEFLSLIYDLYDHVVFPEKKNKIITEKRVGLFKKEIVERYPELDHVKEKISLFKLSLFTTVPDFNRLWDFCEFIRVCEKVFFYPNKPENYLYVEMDLNKHNNGVRKFRYSLERFDEQAKSEIRFTLERDVLGMDIISISVVRDYGLKMNNSYKVIDGDIKYPDSSDLYLINEINIILKECMYNIFSSIVQLILKE